MKKAWLYGTLIPLTLPAAVFLQATLLANSLPGEVTPNLGFLLTVAAGYLWGAAGGAALGMWAGALLGAAAGSMAVPFSCLYGMIGWLAGLHKEREPKAWTLPIASASLACLCVCAESWLSAVAEGSQPSLGYKVLTILWLSLASLAFLPMTNQKKQEVC